MDVAPVSFVMCICPSVLLPAVSERLPLDGFMWNFVLRTFTEIYRENPNLVQIEQKYRALYRKTKYFLLVTATLNPHISDVSYWNCVRFLSCLSVHLLSAWFPRGLLTWNLELEDFYESLSRHSKFGQSDLRLGHCAWRRDIRYIVAGGINPVKTKGRPLYLKPQSVPRCKHFSSRL